MAANDGQDLAGQPASVQQLFQSTYGGNAASVWEQQHNAAIGGGAATNPAAPIKPLNMPDYSSLFAGIGGNTSALTAAMQRRAALLGFTPQPGKDRLSRSLAAIFQGEPSIQEADASASGYDPTDYKRAVQDWIAATGSNEDLNAVKKDPIQFAIKEGFMAPAPPRTVNDMMDQIVLDQLRQNGLMAPELEKSLNAKLEAAYQADLSGKTAAQTNPADDPNSYQLDEATGMYVPKQSVLDAVNQNNGPAAAADGGTAHDPGELMSTAWGPWNGLVNDDNRTNSAGLRRLVVSMTGLDNPDVGGATPGLGHPDSVSDQDIGYLSSGIWSNWHATGKWAIPTGTEAYLDPGVAQHIQDFWAARGVAPAATAPAAPITPITLPTSMSVEDFRKKFEQPGQNPLPPIPSTQMFNQTFNAADRQGVGQLFQGMGIEPNILQDQINKLAPPGGGSNLATPLFTSKGLAGVYG